MRQRIVHKARSFEAARQWDIQQQVDMSASDRLRAVRSLQARVYGKHVPDIRQCRAKR